MRLAVLLVILCSLPTAVALQTPTYWEAQGDTHWTLADGTLCEGTIAIDALRPLSLGEERTSVHAIAEPITDGCAPLEMRFTSAHHGLDLIDEDWGCDDARCYGVDLFWTQDGEGLLEYRGYEGEELFAWVHATRVLRA